MGAHAESGRRPSDSSPLLALFVAATVLPAAALGWLGWRLIEQERVLERQRVQDLAESTANRVTAAIERELGAIERSLGAGPSAGTAPEHPDADSSVTVRLDTRGKATILAGSPLSYDLRPLERLPEPSGELWVEAERLEFIGHDVVGQPQAYRRLAASPDPATRAGALVRLARVLKGSGKGDEALGTYAELVTMTAATLLGDPVDLMARWARVELLASLGRVKDARREAASLDAELRGDRWQLGRTTALTYAEALRPWRTDGDEATREMRLGLSDAVAAVRQEWQGGAPAEPFGSGRRAVRVGERDVLVAWRADGDDLLVYAASPARLFAAWQQYWATPSIAVALVDQQGLAVAGDVPPARGAVVVSRPTSDTRLPWALRVVATSTPGDIAVAGAARRRIDPGGPRRAGIPHSRHGLPGRAGRAPGTGPGATAGGLRRSGVARVPLAADVACASDVAPA